MPDPDRSEADPKRDLYNRVNAYFVSTDKTHAPGNAVAVQERLGIAPAA